MPAATVLLALALRVIPSVTAQSPASSTIATVISQDGLNLRASPSTTASLVTLIPFGSIVTVTGAPTSDGWYPVSFGQFTGYASGVYLAAGSLDPSQARTATPLSLAVAGAVGANVPPTSTPGPFGLSSSVTASPSALALALALNGSAAYQATATYYGVDDGTPAGKIMACGAPFDPYNPHATATNDWPCGTKLRVTSADGRSVEVSVTDHGMYPLHRLDLTYAAFGQIADHHVGVIQVTVQPEP